MRYLVSDYRATITAYHCLTLFDCTLYSIITHHFICERTSPGWMDSFVHSIPCPIGQSSLAHCPCPGWKTGYYIVCVCVHNKVDIIT